MSDIKQRDLIKNAIEAAKMGNGRSVREFIQKVLHLKVCKSLDDKEKEIAKTLFNRKKE